MRICQVMIIFNSFIAMCSAMDFKSSPYNCSNFAPVSYNSVKEVENKCYKLLAELNRLPDPYVPQRSPWPRPHEPYRDICLWLRQCNVEQAKDLSHIISDLSFGVAKDIGADKKWPIHPSQNNGHDEKWDDQGSRIGLRLFILDSHDRRGQCSLGELKGAMHNLLEEMMRGWKKALICNTCIDGRVYQHETSDEQQRDLSDCPYLLDEEAWFFITKPKIIRYEESLLFRLIRLIVPTSKFGSYRSKDNTLLYLWLGINYAQEIIQKLGLHVQ